MSEPKFTPGLWHWAGPCIRNEQDQDLAIVQTETDYEPPFADGEWEANTHLMTAAPDLYAALKSFDLPQSMHVLHDERVSCSVCAARRAIAKAEGRE